MSLVALLFCLTSKQYYLNRSFSGHKTIKLEIERQCKNSHSKHNVNVFLCESFEKRIASVRNLIRSHLYFSTLRTFLKILFMCSDSINSSLIISGISFRRVDKCDGVEKRKGSRNKYSHFVKSDG